MSFIPKSVTGRRQVSCATLDEFLAEAIAAADARTLSNWSMGQIYWHLAAALDAALTGRK